MDTRTDPVPLHRLQVPLPQVPPFAMGSFDSLGPDSRAGYPHRHTFYEIVYVTGGSGAHVIDLVRRPLSPPHLCFLLPGQVHYWERTNDLSGVLMLFTEDFLLARPGDRQLLRALGERSWLHLPSGPADDRAGIGSLIRSMQQEYTARGAGYVSVLEAYLHILLVRALRLPAVPETSATPGRAAEVSREFGLLLTETAGAEGTVGAYAARLGVSVGYLNEAVKQATGRTPGELVRAARTLEAKRLLAGSSLGVGQVARRVGFTDPAYFCRFFRRETGVSPGAFRRTAATAGAADAPATRGNHHVH
ncbi:AraC family transcriptional regulator [Streptomyces sp. SCA3-4]|uniref:helix-turn-helix transcriptional regulator n=1 Tax=Streptomyces sichuanensis TaxID=2871810 RepID=UPI001CE30754|nr:AraC family transcriptional regulator [Streptomyces sichuanensis]MCA6091268.1 AraC family transcriptional regulator [Streptomyces sichuanensis]